MGGVARLGLAVIGLVAVTVLVGAPLVGWPRVVRMPAVLVPALALAGLATRPWQWRESGVGGADWQPSARVVWTAALVSGLVLFWIVLTRFRSGEINAVDFTVYYDRPCFQTVSGRPLFVETSDSPGFSNRSELADHAYWGMLGICSIYAVHPSPLWLLALSAIAVVLGAVYVMRIMQRLAVGGTLASATALAFMLNDNTARTLNYGFHPEVLYAWFIPWMIDAGLRGARKPFLAATFACVMVKEDACLPLFAASVALGLNGFRAMTRTERLLFLVLPTAVGLGNLAFYYGWVVPALTGDSRPSYAHFWANYGDTPMAALLGMVTHPWRVLVSTMTSGFFTNVMLPHMFLPVIAWRWWLGIVPIVALYSASANDQVRAFGIYYAIVLVPFLVLAASSGALALARRLVPDVRRARLAAAGLIVLGALLVGSGNRGYSLRPWKDQIAAVPEALARLDSERLVLVQSGLFPHAGYDRRFLLLTPETLQDARHAGAAVLLASGVGAYPFPSGEIDALRMLPPIAAMPRGVVAVRLPGAPVR